MNFVLQTFVMKLVPEILKAIIGRLPWAAITERFLSRLIVAALRKLAAMSSNALVDQTVDDVIKALETPTLPELK